MAMKAPEGGVSSWDFLSQVPMSPIAIGAMLPGGVARAIKEAYFTSGVHGRQTMKELLGLLQSPSRERSLKKAWSMLGGREPLDPEFVGAGAESAAFLLRPPGQEPLVAKVSPFVESSDWLNRLRLYGAPEMKNIMLPTKPIANTYGTVTVTQPLAESLQGLPYAERALRRDALLRAVRDAGWSWGDWNNLSNVMKWRGQDWIVDPGYIIKLR